MTKIETTIKQQYKWVGAGILFAILWASAATATKIGLKEAQPLVIAQIRFAIGGAIMLFFIHVISGQRLPLGREWKLIAIYGLFNITIYLGCYVIAMQHVTAGVGALSIAVNPLFISFLSVFILKKKLNVNIFVALFLGTAGVVCASWPLLKEARITTGGLLLLLLGMLSYSIGAIFFSAQKWNHLNLLTINGWQTFIGGILLLPSTIFNYKGEMNHFNFAFWGATLWLAIPVSIFAVSLWLWLLKTNTVKAGLWLFLCPIFGFAIAAVILHDHISSYTIIGVALVLIGLFLSERHVKKVDPANEN
ncbi:MAG: EamA family transporter [Bacteroidota bacterium]|nr:EamA family transporter [Bacteroidota bacterium]